MSIAAKKVAPIARLDDAVDADADAQWHEVIDRRSREIEEGKVKCRAVEQVFQDIRSKLQGKGRLPKETPLVFFSRFKRLGLTRRKDLPRKIEA